MRAVVQRVISGSVTVGDEVIGKIDRGIVVLLGINRGDTTNDMEFIARKILSLRIWPSEDGTKTWGRNVKQIDGDILLVSQFTLMHVLKGNKPDFHLAMNPEGAKVMFNQVCDAIKKEYQAEKVATGEFQSYMNVNILNDGPVTLVLDSANKD